MEINDQLIKFVHGNACLYDKRHPKYKNAKIKEHIWEDMSILLKISVMECKVKWKSLRDRFRREKMAEDSPSGSASKTGTPWKYRQCLAFLAHSLEPASTTGNVSEDVNYSEEWLVDEESTIFFCRSLPSDIL